MQQKRPLRDAVRAVGRGAAAAPPLAEQVTLVHPPRHGARRGLQAPFPRRTGRVHGQKQLKTGWIGDGRDEVPPPCRPEGARAAAT